jgi:hypothetical protein
MAEPTPGTPVPPDETDTGGPKHAAPIDGDSPDRPAVARAASEPGAVAAGDASAVRRPGAEDGAPDAGTGSDAAASPVEPVSDRAPVADGPSTRSGSDREIATAGGADADRTTVLPEGRTDAGTATGTDADRTTVLPESRTDGDRTAVLPAERAEGERTPPPPAPEQRTPPLPPADAPPAPRRGSNRLVGTAWVLLAALLFEVVYLAAFALVVFVVAGASAVGLAVQQLISTPFAWLPVLLFALFYELTVLLLNRAGRFAYVLSSLIVAAIVYVLSAVLILAMQEGGIGNESNLGRALIATQVVLIPLVAREVMLWTGLAIGARGHRVRRRNRAAQEQYERERFARSVQESDDGAGTPA